MRKDAKREGIWFKIRRSVKKDEQNEDKRHKMTKTKLMKRKRGKDRNGVRCVQSKDCVWCTDRNGV